LIQHGKIVAPASAPAGSGGVPPRECSATMGPRRETLREPAAETAAPQEPCQDAPVKMPSFTMENVVILRDKTTAYLMLDFYHDIFQYCSKKSH
jgi:hypothetical protein